MFKLLCPLAAALMCLGAVARAQGESDGVLSVALGDTPALTGSKLLLRLNAPSSDLQEVRLGVTNISAKPQTLDVFTFDGLSSAYWSGTASRVSTRTVIAPGAKADIIVKTRISIASSGGRLLLMSGWVPLRAIAIEAWPERAKVSNRATANVNSAYGEGKVTYWLCAPLPPPGYRLVSATPSVTVPVGKPDRKCGGEWAWCYEKPPGSGESACYEFIIQGQHVKNDGIAAGDTDSVIQNIRIEVDSEFQPLPREATLVDLGTAF